MRVLGGLKIGEGSTIDNLTLPIGSSFPEDENIGELFYMQDNPNYVSGVYICRAVQGSLVWQLLIDASSETLEYPVIELGTTQAVDIYSSSPIPLRWDFRSVITPEVFQHDTEVNPERIEIKRDGLYQVSYSVSSQKASSGAQVLRCSVRVDQDREIGRSVTFSYRGGTSVSSNTNTFLVRCSAGQVLDLVCLVVFDTSWWGNRETLTISQNCSLSVARIGDLP